MTPTLSIQDLLSEGLVHRLQGGEKVSRESRSEDRPSFAAFQAVLDQALNATHEWFTDELSGPNVERRGTQWCPPLIVLAHLACRAAVTRPEPRGAVAWVGRRCWPTPWLLRELDPKGRLRHVFVDPREAGERTWAADLCLRCRDVGAVVADGSGLEMAESRRLQLASQAGETPGLLARPAGELRELSAAATRWVVSPLPGESRAARWRVELRRCKGLGGSWGRGAPPWWAVQWVDGWSARLVGAEGTGAPAGLSEVPGETGGVRVAAGVVDRSSPAAARFDISKAG